METLLIQDHPQHQEIILNQPQVRNAFSAKMISELTQVFRSPSLALKRFVTLSGAGKTFCSGADLKWMQEMVNYSVSENEKDADLLFEMFLAIAECPVPVIAFVQGAAFGGALGLLAACDFVVAEEGAQFCFSEVKLGLVPAVISPFVLRKASQGHARPWMISGKVFDVWTALHMGLVTEVVKALEMDQKTKDLKSDFLNAGPEALKSTKALMNRLALIDLQKERRSVVQLIAKTRVGPEGQAGLKAFLNKATAPWKGSL